jgi:hypothetical protein
MMVLLKPVKLCKVCPSFFFLSFPVGLLSINGQSEVLSISDGDITGNALK